MWTKFQCSEQRVFPYFYELIVMKCYKLIKNNLLCNYSQHWFVELLSTQMWKCSDCVVFWQAWWHQWITLSFSCALDLNITRVQIDVSLMLHVKKKISVLEPICHIPSLELVEVWRSYPSIELFTWDFHRSSVIVY